MIKYALKCHENHTFESWFQSADAFEKLQANSMVACPECGSTSVKKALMAPPVRPARSAAIVQKQPTETESVPEQPTKGEQESALAKLKSEIEANSDYVGDSFAKEARAMHLGEAPERSIYGEAKAEDAKSLIEDGVPVLPLPFRPTRKVN